MSQVGHFWVAGLHHVTARFLLVGVLKLTNRLFILFSSFGEKGRAAVNRG
jgi:hypothetical protein